MVENQNNYFSKNKYIKGNLKFAVIGHIEWINFLKVDSLPEPGLITHAQTSLELPAGGGALIAKTLYELSNNEIHFFTSLGKDYYGNTSILWILITITCFSLTISLLNKKYKISNSS